MVNNASPVAMYYQLKEILAKEIREGKWPAQTKMSSEREICETYKVSRVTARKAIDLLAKEGYVYTVKGKGTFVKGKYLEQPLTHFYSFRGDLRRKGVTARSKMRGFAMEAADEELAQDLQILPGEKVFRIERVFYAGELPYAREISYLPCQLCEGLTKGQVVSSGLYNSLKEYNIYPTRATEKLKAYLLDRETASLLDLPENDAAIYITRITYCNDTVVEKNISYVRGDMFVYSVELQNR